MNRYTIWQVKREFLYEYGFCDLMHLTREGKTRRGVGDAAPYELPRDKWERVYVYETEKEPSLEWLFRFFNRCDGFREKDGPPEDYTGHSMSVSDIIETPDGTLWFCDSFGWEKIRWAN